MAEINKNVIDNGVVSTLNDSGKYFSLFLLNDSDEVVATSAALKRIDTTVEEDTFFPCVDWLDNKIMVKNLSFEQTKSLLTGNEEETVTQYCLCAFNEGDFDDPSPAYEGSDKNYYWPISSDIEAYSTAFIFKGGLTNSIEITADNNFKFNEISVAFSAVEA